MSFESFLTRCCTQTAVYWASPTEDGYGGKTYSDPVEISCRWEDGGEIIRDNMGEEYIPVATVYVLQDVDENGRLFLGTLADLDSSDEESPENATGAYEIKKFVKTPALGSTTSFLRKVIL